MNTSDNNVRSCNNTVNANYSRLKKSQMSAVKSIINYSPDRDSYFWREEHGKPLKIRMQARCGNSSSLTSTTSSNTVMYKVPVDRVKQSIRRHEIRNEIKIDRENLVVVEDEIHDDITLEELVEELPENAPRYIVLSYEDGRKSYPLVLIYYSPISTNPEAHMLYTSSKVYFQQKADLNKTFDIRELELLNDEWLKVGEIITLRKYILNDKSKKRARMRAAKMENKRLFLYLHNNNLVAILVK
nr:14884_t:CDS:10 [Entrophospora candida]